MDNPPHPDPEQRMQGYLQKIATGPKMSKDLTREEAEDGLRSILNGSVSQVRAGIFLIAARMKLETVEENIGYWQALDKTTIQHEIPFEKILQIADPFDGFNRVPYFGFFVMPVLAAMGLPAYGHSARSLPPKFGITFEDLLGNHYGVSSTDSGEKRIALLKKHRFGYLSTRHTNPALEGLRDMRREIVKRPMLATLEKMLMPVKAKRGGNFLASGYFHKGYEISMLAVARLSEFDKTILGNGAEGTTFYGVHKDARVFIDAGDKDPVEKKLVLDNMFSPKTCDLIKGTYQDLKKETATLEFLSEWGETALKNNQGPAAPLIACHAGTLCHLLRMLETPQEGFDAAQKILQGGTCYAQLMEFLAEIK
jgi:anthranilate phosphoribosyltransferase